VKDGSWAELHVEVAGTPTGAVDFQRFVSWQGVKPTLARLVMWWKINVGVVQDAQ
jgi:hypothetical protein